MKNDIHNLDTLDKEIYRQQLVLKESSKKMEDDLAYVRDNFFTLAKNSIKKERKKEEGGSSLFDRLLRNDHVQEVVSGITDRITDHASKAISHLVDRLFQKHK
jgi:hypothetical protein